MALKVQASFSTGELDPALHERTTLAKYKSGLKTGRNVVVSKVGSILSSPGRSNFKKAKLTSRRIKTYSPPRSGYLIEWGHEYVRIYTSAGSLVADTAHALTEANLPNIHFESGGDIVYIFCDGQITLRLNYKTGVFVSTSFSAAPVSGSLTTAVGSGYAVDYLVSAVRNGQESLANIVITGGFLPIAAGESNVVDAIVQAGTTNTSGVTEMRIYRRPANGGTFGFIGSSSYIVSSGGNLHMLFTDLGFAADYTHSPIQAIATPTLNGFGSKTGIIYQQRLLITWEVDKEGIYASRPGYRDNLTRDFPLNSDSALQFKAGSSGGADILRMLEADGLVVFTKQGIFLNTGPLTPTNIALEKKAKNLIDENVPPLAVPGGVFFVDLSTNSIRALSWSTELAGYLAPEVSVFSNHLFARSRITSWAFHEGSLPVLWVTFNDGTYAAFTYEFEQEMRAWTRQDSYLDVEEVCGTGIADTTYFVVKKGNDRYIEVTNARFVSAARLTADPEADKGPEIAFMDSIVSYNGLLNGSLAGADVFTLTPVTPGDWAGSLTLACGTSAIFTSPGPGAVGEVHRMFDEDGTNYDLTVTARASNNSITVTPSTTIPTELRTTPRIYRTKVTFTGLDHLDGEDPGIIVDGAVLCSPYNTKEDYPTATVASGSVTLPESVRGAIVHIGRVKIGDVETLDVDTVEQAPTLIESMTIDKVYVKIHNSRGFYVANKLPDDDNNDNMESIDQYDVNYDQLNPITGNRYIAPTTKRVEIATRGSWDTNGRLACRQVDPVHFEILSIIPDLEVLRRSDR
jgi:hypothetical protein